MTNQLPKSLVHALLEEAGFRSWVLADSENETPWGHMANLAVAVEATIQNTIVRAKFVAQAVEELSLTTPEEAEKYADLEDLAYLQYMAEGARPTPCGSTELWGSAWQKWPEPEEGDTWPEPATDCKVAWHEGGQLFAGDEEDWPEGWYLFDGWVGATPVTVLTPGGNEPLVPSK